MIELSGQVIKGFELRERIGEGGFGAVYRAYQPLVGREVAIKVILPEFANEPNFIRRFEIEAQLIARLEHPFIVPLYDYWREPDGAYLVMRALRTSLRADLKKGPWKAEDAARLLSQIGGALTTAHRHSVIHRDIKPGNILLDEDNNAYLADFGIAVSADQPSGTRQEETGIGSLGYVTPEQLKGEKLTPQTDLYSLGLVMYEVLTGVRPFGDELTVTTLIDKQLGDPVPPLAAYRQDLPALLDTVIQQATAKEPSQRYADARSMILAFGQALAGRVPGAKVVGTDTANLAIPLEPENPYKGLRAFRAADVADFFGREALIRRLLERVAEPGEMSRFLAVVGPSGSGKSSVVHAGLIPALRRGALPGSERWFVVDMQPGAHPLDDLEAALLSIAVKPPEATLGNWREDEHGLSRMIRAVLPPDEDIDLLLVIDQFEELFTLLEDETARAHFLRALRAALLELGGRLRVVITLRADFVDRPLQYVSFGELMRTRTEFVLPLSPDELEQAIVRPAERVGVAFEGDLIAAIINEVGDQPGTLPLLQYALTELFERRKGHMLTLKDYRASGGVLGALARHAEELYNGLDAVGQAAARQLFLRLVQPGDGVDDMRRRVGRAELASLARVQPALEPVIELFGRHRLLTFDTDSVTRSPTVEVAHEALIRTWRRLRDWLAASREELLIQRRLMAAAAEWAAAGRETSFLASGARLDQFEAWSHETSLSLSQEESEYLQSSIAERIAQHARDEARIAREAATTRLATNFRRAAIILGVVGVLSVAAIFVLGIQVRNAVSQVSQANALVSSAQMEVIFAGQTLTPVPMTLTAVGQQIADSQNTVELLRLSAEADKLLLTNNGNVETAALLSIRALNSGYLPQADAALRQAVEHVYTRLIFTGHASALYGVAFSPNGTYVVTGAADNTAILWDAHTARPLQTFKGHTGPVESVAFSPDSQYVLTGSKDETARLWDIRTGRTVRIFTSRFSPVYSPGHTGAINAVAFSPDGKFVVTGSRDKAARIWDVYTGHSIRVFEHIGGVFGVAFSPDSKYIVTGIRDNVAVLWDAQTGENVRTFTGHTGAVWTVAFSPDSRFVLTGSGDNTARLWEVKTGITMRTFSGHTGDLTSVAFSPDGKSVLTGSTDNTARLWDIQTGAALRTFTGHNGAVWSVAFSPDGGSVLTGSDDEAARLWDAQAGDSPSIVASHPAAIWSVAVSPDGKTILTASDDRTAQLWDAQSHAHLMTFNDNKGPVYAAAFSPDGKLIVTGSSDNTPRLWDAQSGKLLHVFQGPTNTDAIYGLVFSPDGKTMASAGVDNVARLWDVQSGQMLGTFTGHKATISSVAFSPDGKYLLTGSEDRTARLWNVQTTQVILTLSDHTDTVSGVAFSPDGKYLLTGSNDTTAHLWDAQTGKSIRTFIGHSNAVASVAFSPDGKYILTGSADTTARLWDTQTGASLRTFVGHSNAISSVAFTRDGKTVLTASADKSVRQWETSYTDFVANACLSVSRDFTDEERLRYALPDKKPTCPRFASSATPTATATP